MTMTAMTVNCGGNDGVIDDRHTLTTYNAAVPKGPAFSFLNYYGSVRIHSPSPTSPFAGLYKTCFPASWDRKTGFPNAL